MGNNCPVTNSLFLPFISTMSLRYGPKMGKKRPNFSAIGMKWPLNQELAGSWARWLKIEFRGHLVHPQPPTFRGFQPSISPNEKPEALYQWSFGGTGGQPRPHMLGANGGSTRAENIFSKLFPTPFGMLKHVFLAPFEPVVNLLRHSCKWGCMVVDGVGSTLGAELRRF